mgnify:CR=1 FL=1
MESGFYLCTMVEKDCTIAIKYILYASPEKVFEALTQESVIKKWIEGEVVFELKKEGRVELFDQWVKGELLSFKKNSDITYTWKPNTWDKKTKPSIVEIHITAHAAGSEIEITHSDFPNQEEAEKHRQGWIDYVFEPLNDYLIQQL